ncbi:MAG: hypothetical protein M5U34_11350 [Chloroflexi bacterium]|nr:hypothetical protein [Chloroflexota bacterium]
MFVNPSNDYADSPFIFLMMVLTWLLGTLVVVAEMVKSEEIIISEDAASPPQKMRAVGAAFLVLGAAAVALRLFLPRPLDSGATWMLGQTLLPLLGVFCLYVGIRFLLNLPAARLWGGGLALAGVALALPMLVAGGLWLGLATAVIALGLLWFLWQKRVARLPAAGRGHRPALVCGGRELHLCPGQYAQGQPVCAAHRRNYHPGAAAGLPRV